MNEFWALSAAVGICVSGQVLYHMLVKGIEKSASPYVVVGIAYMVGLLIMGVAFLLDPSNDGLNLDRGTLLRAAAIGLGVSMVELGYVFAYRSGLPLSTGPITVLALTTVALFPVAAIAFKDGFRPQVAVGVVVTLFGLWLMRP